LVDVKAAGAKQLQGIAAAGESLADVLNLPGKKRRWSRVDDDEYEDESSSTLSPVRQRLRAAVQGYS
jgi:hypothetical protein